MKRAALCLLLVCLHACGAQSSSRTRARRESCDRTLADIAAAAEGVASIGNPSTRDAWMQRFAQSVPAGARVIDVSAGAKPYAHLWTHVDYLTHEFDGNDRVIDAFRGESGASAKKHDFSGDVTRTTAPSASFDVVILTEVLEHVPEPILAVKELARLCKPGGSILVTAPFTSGSHQEPYHFYAGFSPNWYKHVARKYGLRIESIASQGDYFKLMAQEVGRSLTCGGRLRGVPQRAIERLVGVASEYLLKLSSAFGDGSASKAECASQFAIGYMVHFKKN